jgi:trk system potassium uptake protein TrkA
VQWATERVLRRILPDQSAVEWIDPSARVAMIERAVPSAWAGRKLGELEVDGLARVVGVSRLGVGQVPTLDLVIQEGDVAYVAVTSDRVEEFEQHLGGGSDGGRH